jgi:hypothetical protein
MKWCGALRADTDEVVWVAEGWYWWSDVGRWGLTLRPVSKPGTTLVYRLGQLLENYRYTNLLNLTPAVSIVKASYLDEQKDWPRSKRYPNTTIYLL